MKRIIQLAVVVVVLSVAVGYWFDVPYLSRVRDTVDSVIGTSSKSPESAKDCGQCEQFCSDQFNECKRKENCDEFGDQGEYSKCIEKCTDRYRACYLGCKGKFGDGNCPQPSVSGVF